jgi:hypothetical protein
MRSVNKLARRFAKREVFPWRMRRLGGVWNTMVAVHLRRVWLASKLSRATARLNDDITVVIPVRNRVDYRLRNALISVSGQRYDQGDVRITVVDYASEPCAAAQLKCLSNEFGANYVRAEAAGPWSRAHSSNIGIRLAQTKFVVSTDADVIFAENFLCESVRALRERPLSVVYSQCLDLPESCERQLQVLASRHGPLDLDDLRRKSRAIRRYGHESVGINASYTFFYHLIRGYDEYFKCYGSEDDDLAQRFLYLGLHPVSVSARTYYLHQWHPQHFRKPDETYACVSDENEVYYATNHSILRNQEGWGEI